MRHRGAKQLTQAHTVSEEESGNMIPQPNWLPASLSKTSRYISARKVTKRTPSEGPLTAHPGSRHFLQSFTRRSGHILIPHDIRKVLQKTTSLHTVIAQAKAWGTAALSALSWPQEPQVHLHQANPTGSKQDRSHLRQAITDSRIAKCHEGIKDSGNQLTSALNHCGLKNLPTEHSAYP